MSEIDLERPNLRFLFKNRGKMIRFLLVTQNSDNSN